MNRNEARRNVKHQDDILYILPTCINWMTYRRETGMNILISGQDPETPVIVLINVNWRTLL